MNIIEKLMTVKDDLEDCSKIIKNIKDDYSEELNEELKCRLYNLEVFLRDANNKI